MKFGYQLGSGATAQRNAFARNGLLNVLRFPMVPDVAGTGFDQSQTIGVLQYCQTYGATPHVTLYDADRNYPVDWTAYAELFFNTIWNMGITQASFEVGNEFDMPNWLHPGPDVDDSIFLTYVDLYEKCSNALKAFLADHPTADFIIGGSAAATGEPFMARVLSWAQSNNHLMFYASWHHYGYFDADSSRLQGWIDDIRLLDANIPVWLTEVGYDPFNLYNSTEGAVTWATNFLWPSRVDEIIWLTACPDIWATTGIPTPIGHAVLDYLCSL